MSENPRTERVVLMEPRHWYAHVEAYETALAGLAQDDARREKIGVDVDLFGRPLPRPYMVADLAVVPVRGPMIAGLPPLFQRYLGITEPRQVAEWIDGIAGAQAGKILLDIDSPGGVVTGIPELARMVRRVQESGRARVYSWTCGMMCSAAYWVGSQAEAVFAAPSATVGSVGVYVVHYDITEMLEKYGIRAELFKSGSLKAAGVQGVPLSDEQRGFIQAEVDAIGEEFRATVRAVRSSAREDAMRGQGLNGRQAAAAGLVTCLRDRLPDLLSDLTGAAGV